MATYLEAPKLAETHVNNGGDGERHGKKRRKVKRLETGENNGTGRNRRQEVKCPRSALARADWLRDE